MNIMCKSNSNKPGTQLQPGQQVNKIGKYLYKHLDGAYKIEFSVNTCDVYVTLLYQLKYLNRIPGRGREYNGVHEMTLNLNITAYNNKSIRVNVTELTPEERTIGHQVYSPEIVFNLEEAKKVIFGKIVKQVSKLYEEEYDFIF